ncbi:glutamate synthase large subunit [Actinoplanes sichuanensis]|nr:glutamate synthase large subunit [Actinoplanes sichuanensis]BEL04352.1 glutamate synthase large subunit [Actinoplanes sichuanensis]
MASAIAAVADLHGRRSHDVIAAALSALTRLDHRGARGADPEDGDGAGLIFEVPDAFCRAVAGVELPDTGHYATGLVFLPADPTDAARAIRIFEKYALVEGLEVLSWRDVPVVPAVLGPTADRHRPTIRQVFLAGAALPGTRTGRAGEALSGIELERVAYCVRRQTERETAQRGLDAYFPSLSTRTITYKGRLTSYQLSAFFPDLKDGRLTSATALACVNVSETTTPGWTNEQPGRIVAHAGTITSLGANRNWMAARESVLSSEALPGNIRRLFPIVTADASGGAAFDAVLELLYLTGRSLPHAVAMMMPSAWENDLSMDPQVRAFHRYHACVMEPWYGSGPVAFSDGATIGMTTDRLGGGSGRWCHTADGLVVLGSEAGLLDLDPATVVAQGRLRPGEMLLVDTTAGRIVADAEIKAGLAVAEPYGDWLQAGLIDLVDLPPRQQIIYTHDVVTRRQLVFGYGADELELAIAPMARDGWEPRASMVTDMPLSVLSSRPRLLFDYFSPRFAPFSGPPVDPVREEPVTSLAATIGPEANLLAPGPASCRQITLPYPILDNDDLAKLLSVDDDGDLPGYQAVRVSGLYSVRDGAAGIKERLTQICRHVSEAIEDGVRILVLSDRDSNLDLAPIPSLLLTAAVHQHLVREQTRTQVSLLVEAGDCRAARHAALLVAYGASAVNPWLAYETIDEMIISGALGDMDRRIAIRNFIKALGRGILRTMAEAGVAAISSYCAGQSYEAIGLDHGFLKRYFTGTSGRIGGAGLPEVHAEVSGRHQAAYPFDAVPVSHLPPAGGWERWREGEPRLFDPEVVFLLQHATQSRQYDIFQRYTRAVDERAAGATLRGLMRMTSRQAEVPLDEVEPVSEIVKRFVTGAISYGAIASEAHETLAMAMNRLGGRSSTGDGGEDVERSYDPIRRSSIKRVAPGRFGVTSEYLVNADEFEIPLGPAGESMLPADKVWPWIARTRRVTPSLAAESPPWHPDVTSPSDLAQLVHDLKMVNPAARVRVSISRDGASAGVLAKLKADVIVVSPDGADLGAATAIGPSPSLPPWELTLAEAQQTLLTSGLRDRVVLGVGGLATGRDIVIAALLGAEEFGFATAPLIVSGCVMMRVCHLGTCPAGIASQQPYHREFFVGRPEFVENFFVFLAEQVREQLAELGFRTIDEAVGHCEVLDPAPEIRQPKGHLLDLSPLLHVPDLPDNAYRRGVVSQDHGLDHAMDNTLIELAMPALINADPVRSDLAIRNDHRSVGAMLGGEVTRRYGGSGLPEDTISFTMRGTAGQSFGAFLPPGVTLRLLGTANDYVAKGLCGGRVIACPDVSAPYVAQENAIAGNAVLYGATGGELFLGGRVGERFALRNCGAHAVVEGLGDHGCAYMSGGVVVVLGPVGHNFASGMTGGTAFVLDLDATKVNPEHVAVDRVSPEQSRVLFRLMRKHATETGSTVVDPILAGWASQVLRFSVVVSRDHERVMERIRIAEAAGRDVDEAAMGYRTR